MIGTEDNPIEINKIRFAGRCKYNWGCMLLGDAPPLSEDWNEGAQIDGPWVLGLCQGHCHYFIVEKCRKEVLILLIVEDYLHEIELHWSGYWSYWTLMVWCQDSYLKGRERSHPLVTLNPWWSLLQANVAEGQAGLLCSNFQHQSNIRVMTSLIWQHFWWWASFWKTCKPSSSWCLLGNANRLVKQSRVCSHYWRFQ